jgi:hypothetical protein
MTIAGSLDSIKYFHLKRVYWDFIYPENTNEYSGLYVMPRLLMFSITLQFRFDNFGFYVIQNFTYPKITYFGK